MSLMRTVGLARRVFDKRVTLLIMIDDYPVHIVRREDMSDDARPIRRFMSGRQYSSDDCRELR